MDSRGPYLGPTVICGRTIACTRCGTLIDLVEIGGRVNDDTFVGLCCLLAPPAEPTQPPVLNAVA